jgi:hypothetical protein
MFCHKSGLGYLAKEVDNNFDIKIYTSQMLKAIAHPRRDLSQTQEAYQYFTAMYNGQSFTTKTGSLLDFQSIPPDVADTLHSEVVKILQDYDTVSVPTNNNGGTATLLKSDGTKATLLDVIANPMMQFQINFQTSTHFIDQGPDTSPGWSFSNGEDLVSDASNANNDCGWNDKMAYQPGTHIHFGVNGLDATTHEPACSHHIDWNITGEPETWENIGALQPIASDPSAASTNLVTLENYLVKHM